MSDLILTEDKVQFLVQIETSTKTLEKKINDFTITNPSDTIVAKSLKDEATKLEKMVDEMRDSTVRPYNEFVKQVNAKAKEYSLPIEKIKEGIVGKIKAYELKVKAEEDRKNRLISEAVENISKAQSIEEVENIYTSLEYKNPTIDFMYTQRKIDITETIRIAEVKKQQEKEADRLADLKKTADNETIKFEEQKQALANQQRDLDEQKAQFEAQKIQREVVSKIENEIVIPTARVKSTRTVWKMEIINPDEVPRDFCIPNETKIREAIKTGTREIK